LDVNLAALKPLALVHGVMKHHLGHLLVWFWVAPASARKLVLPEVPKRDHVAKHVFIARVSR
jgi:hypothetical protein